MNRMLTRLSFLSLSFVVLFGLTSYADGPGPITVTNLNDHGSGSLRDAVQRGNGADTKGGPQVILFKSGMSGTINLTSGPLQLRNNFNIKGPGATTITVNNSGANSSVFVNSVGNSTISGLSVTGGNNSAGGGGISNAAALTLDRMMVVNNIGGNGAGVLNSSGGTLVVTNSTLANNNSSGFGGGVYNAGTATLINSTVSDNRAVNGGGVYSTFGATVSLTNATVAFNTASSNGGGLYNEKQVSTNIGNTIVAKNNGTVGPDVFQADSNNLPGGLITNSKGYNLIGNADGSSGWNGFDKTGNTAMPLDPQLGPLQNNGGTTTTRALASTSPAVDMGSNALAVDQFGAALPNDQRGSGFPRIVNTFVDIGAFELQGSGGGGGVPRQLKIQASNMLQAALPTGNAKTDQLFNDAISHINKSTAANLWTDDSHVVGDGNTVFDNEESAAADLTNSGIVASQQATAQAALNDLYSADNQLASDEINYASTHGGNASKLATAQQNYNKAATDTGQQKIEDYEQAFQNAYHSLP